MARYSPICGAVTVALAYGLLAPTGAAVAALPQVALATSSPSPISSPTAPSPPTPTTPPEAPPTAPSTVPSAVPSAAPSKLPESKPTGSHVSDKPPVPAKKKKKKKKKPDNPVVDMAVVLAIARAELASARPQLAAAAKRLAAARKQQASANRRFEQMPIAPRPLNVGWQGLLTQPEPGRSGLEWALTVFALPVSSGGSSEARAAAQQADDALAQAQATYDLIRLNVATAKVTLGIADGALSVAQAGEQLSSYPVGKCDFGVANPKSCQDAQRWAVTQAASPSKNWFNLCLNFVTIAYGYDGGEPTAAAKWNALPASRKHSPNSVAPPGALMFWAPNHVALSLGNNMMVSTDVQGNGRAWIVSFATIQAIWRFQYLGWSDPYFGV